MIILTIICFCWLLYSTGIWSKFMEHFIIEPETITETRAATTPPPHPAAVDPITDREKLERAAAYIVQKEGHNPDSVLYMSDGLLNAVINDYIKENKTS